MDPYFPIILTQNVLLCMITACFVFRSTILQTQEKNAFYTVLIMGILIALCEYISSFAMGNPKLIWLQTLASYTDVGITPFLPIIPVLMVAPSRKIQIFSLVPSCINLIFLFSGLLFTIYPDGSYSRDPLFWVFMVSYISSMVILTGRSLLFSYHNQNHNAAGLLLVSLFMISSTTIQLRHPQIHFSWFCVTVTTLLYFIYYTDVLQQRDSLTGLLNRNAFRTYTEKYREKISGIMMIDLDDFKSINDNYGHLVGDEYLLAFSDCLRVVFQHSGNCYRLGGDEFCVLLNKTSSRLSPETLTDMLLEACANLQGLPAKLSFSYGYRVLEEQMDLSDAINEADKSMYASKTAKKKLRS